MYTTPNIHTRALHSTMSETPYLSLNFYSFCVTLCKSEGEKNTEYPVDPAQVAVALASKITFSTGLLTGDTLYIHTEGVKKTVVEYRRPQMTGIYLDGTKSALRVPLPGLVMIRKTADNRNPNYTVYAVKHRPKSLDVDLFYAPLPNVFNSGSICWGTVQRVSDAGLSGASLAEDWSQLLGSPFGDHACSGKSKAFKDDVRKQLIALEARSAKRYPTSDLIPARRTLAQAVNA